MEDIGNIKVLFIAGFGPIIPGRLQVASFITRSSVLASKKKVAAIFIRRPCKARKPSLCGRFRK